MGSAIQGRRLRIRSGESQAADAPAVDKRPFTAFGA
jgi:hypothetical protein